MSTRSVMTKDHAIRIIIGGKKSWKEREVLKMFYLTHPQLIKQAVKERVSLFHKRRLA